MTKRNGKERESGKKKKIKLQLAKEKCSIYRLCFATNKTLNSTSISQRLRKKVKREWMQLVGLGHQTLSSASANLTILITSSFNLVWGSTVHWTGTSCGWYLFLGVIHYNSGPPKFSAWINYNVQPTFRTNPHLPVVRKYKQCNCLNLIRISSS